LQYFYDYDLVPEESRVKRLPSLAHVLLLLTFAAGASPAAAQSVTLRYRWAKGDVVTYRLTSQTDTSVTGMPGAGPMTLAQTMTQVLKFTAEEIAADGTATLRQTFESIKMQLNGPSGRVTYDTAAPNTNPNPMIEAMRRVLGAMAGESIVVVMAADGTVVSISGTTKILDKIAANLPQDPGAEAITQGMKSILSEEALKATLAQSFAKLPADPVKVGDTWRGQLALGAEIVGKILGTSTFTLKAIEGTADAQIARIAVALVLKQESVAAPSGPANIVMRLGDSKGEGEMMFDVGKGRIRRSTMRTDMPSIVSMTSPDGNPGSVQNKTTTTTTMELVEK
jgi:hypothetical protein